MNAYERRNRELRQLGFATYKDFLRSDLWKQTRAKVLAGFSKCLLCGQPSTQVHHMSYDTATLLGIRLYRCIALCEPCHKNIEFDDGKKLTLCQANVKLSALLKLTEKGRNWLRYSSKAAYKHQRNLKEHRRSIGTLR